MIIPKEVLTMDKPEATKSMTDAASWTEHLARAAEAFAREMRSGCRRSSPSTPAAR